ncbi:hypothetical protein [Pseudomonas aeruginosa]|uniref:hypothetical protein n=1 Tax=Pseudomonas aeruginosa TaxID=287 RepID=UPI0039E8CA29
MKKIFTDTLRAFAVDQAVRTPQGNGVIQEVRDNCKFPIFVRFPCGRVDAFTQAEIE